MKLSQIFSSTIGAFIAIILFVIIGVLFFSNMINSAIDEAKKKPTLEEPSVLVVNLDQPIREKSSRNEWQGFNFDKLKPIHQLGLNELKTAISSAAKDENIKALLIELNFVQTGMAMTHEIGLELIKFKESGKKIYAYGDAFNEKAFYLSTFADENYLNPNGYIEFNGLVAEVLYFKDMLKKLGIKPTLFRVGKFKSAMEPFIRTDMSEANRKQVNTYLNSVYDDFLEDIVQNKKTELATLQSISADMIIKFPEDAVQADLLSGTAYYDELTSKFPTQETIDLEEYLGVIAVKTDNTSSKVAIVVAEGPIVDGGGDKNEIGGTSLAETLRKIRNDENIEAIVLRVNSPGGSALASDVIWREVKLLADKKTLIVSMSDYAASGGYYISAPADKIVANPKTITGSIGVFGLLINAEEFLNDKLGITTDRVTTGRHSDIGNPTRSIPFADSVIIQEGVNKIYETFLQKVADGRGMTTPEVHEIAQGRVWSGIDAKELGLVDELGTLDKAIALAVEEANLEAYDVEYYPKKKNWYEKLFDSGDVESSLIKSKLGSMSKYFESLSEILRIKGIQARMPYLLEVE